MTSPLMQNSKHSPGLQQQQWSERSPQQRSLHATATEPSRRRQQPQQPASAPKPRTVEELWAILDSAPTGQPVEIDAGLLYGGESSYDDRSAGAASGSASPGATSFTAREHRQQWQEPAADDFRLSAYRPPVDELAEGSLGPLQDSTAARAAYSRGRQQPQKQGQQQQSGWSPGSAASPPGDEQPKPYKSSPSSQRHHHHWQLCDENAQQQEELAPCTSRRSSHQLLLDEFAAAEGDDRGCLLAAAAAAATTSQLLRRRRDDRLEQLAKPRTQLWERCSARRAEQQRDELAQCTFAPTTGRPPSRHRLVPGLPVEDRLLKAADGRQVALEHAAREAASAEVAECTFAPRLLSDPTRHLRDPERRPIHQRLGEEQRQRSAKLAAARLKGDIAGPELTFQPALNQRSLALAAARRERDLFAGPTRPRSTGGAAIMPASPGTAVADCTFSPAVNPASKALLEGSIAVPADFHERQRFFAAKRELAARRAAVAAASEACTFRPDTGNAVEVLAQSDARSWQLLESKTERCERMAREEAERQAARRAAREAEVYGALEFRPTLNPRSLAIGKVSGPPGKQVLRLGRRSSMCSQL